VPRWASAARHILHAVLLAGEQAVILAGQEMAREPVARWPGDRSTGSAPRPHSERSYPQDATTLQGETLFQQPDRRMHKTGLDCTSLHRFRTMAISTQKCSKAEPEMLYAPGHTCKLERPARVCYQPSKLVMRVRFPSPAPAY
jgi:hypothetical protein